MALRLEREAHGTEPKRSDGKTSFHHSLKISFLSQYFIKGFN